MNSTLNSGETSPQSDERSEVGRQTSDQNTSLFSWLKNLMGINKASGAVYDEAAEKFLRLHEHNVEAEDWLAFQMWVSQSERHAQVIERMDKFWCDLEQLDTIPWPTEEECREDDYNGDRPIPLSSPGAVANLASDGRSRMQSRSSNTDKRVRWCVWLPASGLAALGMVIAFMLWPMLLGVSAVYQTGVGEHRLVTLQDGSEILLGGKTTARVDYSDGIRRVYLDAGEALFTVAKEPDRTFVVTSGSANVVAVGTQFNVHRLMEEVVVSVMEGVVNVSTDSIENYEPEQQVKAIAELARPSLDGSLQKKATRLTVGQQIKLSDRRNMSDVRKVKNDEVLSWRDGRLIYSGDPLSAVISDVNRYHSRPIEIVDDELEQLLFSGTVNKDEIDDWLNGLQSVFDIEVVTNDKSILIMAKREKNFE